MNSTQFLQRNLPFILQQRKADGYKSSFEHKTSLIIVKLCQRNLGTINAFVIMYSSFLKAIYNSAEVSSHLFPMWPLWVLFSELDVSFLPKWRLPWPKTLHVTLSLSLHYNQHNILTYFAYQCFVSIPLFAKHHSEQVGNELTEKSTLSEKSKICLAYALNLA